MQINVLTDERFPFESADSAVSAAWAVFNTSPMMTCDPGDHADVEQSGVETRQRIKPSHAWTATPIPRLQVSARKGLTLSRHRRRVPDPKLLRPGLQPI